MSATTKKGKRMNQTLAATNLLEYVIDYLQEEQRRNRQQITQEDIREWVDMRVDDAIDAYEGRAQGTVSVKRV